LRGAGPTTGVTLVAGEKALCAWNGTDFVKIATTASVSSFSAGSTGFTPSTATTGAVTLAGTLANTNGGTGQSSAFTQYGMTYANSTTTLATTAAGTSTTVLHGNASGAPTFGAVSLTADVSGTLPVSNGGTGLTTLTANYIPYGNGTGAYSSSSTFTFNGTTFVAPAASLSISALSSSNTSNFQVGAVTGFSDTGIIANFVATSNGYTQVVTQNKSNGSAATAEFIAYNDNGTASTNFATVGINSSTYSGTGSINAAGYGYFLTGSTDLVIGTIGANALHMTVNSSATDALSISSTGLINVNSNTAGTALLTVTTSTTTPALKVPNIVETGNTVGSAPSATTNFYLSSGAVQYYTTNAANNWTVNFAFSSGTTLNTAMAVGDSMSCTLLATQGSTAYYNSAVTIDGTSVTPKWQGGTAPTSGNASGIDSYTYVILKVGSASYTVLASQTKFA
jgi:hypothetical protein